MKIEMKFINKIKELMYSNNTPILIRLELNDIIFYYDEDRAKSDIEVKNARKEWAYRFDRINELKRR